MRCNAGISHPGRNVSRVRHIAAAFMIGLMNMSSARRFERLRAAHSLGAGYVTHVSVAWCNLKGR
jgi:hypothetical protein